MAQNAAPTVKRVTQELGGKSPNIILEDADLEAAVTRGVMHMYNNTDNLVTPSRMLVPRHLLSQAESIAAAVTESVVHGAHGGGIHDDGTGDLQNTVGQDSGVDRGRHC
ncbi:MAG: hypothetical protein CM15mP74_07960 [Halieaceae bacterium]|nr:MAG: hypothetical protein CM15mP74_07960 [Halieaceae bacterium]